MSEEKPGAAGRERPDLVAENRNPLSRGREEPVDASSGNTRSSSDTTGEASGGPRHARRGRAATNQAMMGWMIALIGAIGLLLTLIVLWTLDMIRLPAFGVAAIPTRELILGPTIESQQSVLGGSEGSNPVADVNAGIPAPGSISSAAPVVGPRFQAFFDSRGGTRILGSPLSDPITVNGREIQWFERGRLEHWPEFAGTAYEVQLGRVGAEFTTGRQFAQQQFFVSQPGLYYFAETGHAVGGAFLTFWEQNGGLDIFGLPLSEEFDEVLSDGRTYRVQYFERARMELHPDLVGTGNEVQLGLLGTALYRNDSRPSTIQPIPTVVPLP